MEWFSLNIVEYTYSTGDHLFCKKQSLCCIYSIELLTHSAISHSLCNYILCNLNLRVMLGENHGKVQLWQALGSLISIIRHIDKCEAIGIAMDIVKNSNGKLLVILLFTTKAFHCTILNISY